MKARPRALARSSAWWRSSGSPASSGGAETTRWVVRASRSARAGAAAAPSKAMPSMPADASAAARPASRTVAATEPARGRSRRTIARAEKPSPTTVRAPIAGPPFTSSATPHTSSCSSRPARHSVATSASSSPASGRRGRGPESLGRPQPRQRPHRCAPHERRGVREPRFGHRRQRRVGGVADRHQDVAHEAVAAVRLIGDPAKWARKAASSSPASTDSGGASRSGRAESFASRPSAANLFHGQTIRQSSQP